MPRIKEDQAGFLEKTKGKGYHVGYYNPLFKGDPESKQKARDVKRSFSEEADQAFFQSLTKIHWFQGNAQSRLQKILNSGGKDEISTSGYKPGAPLVSNWGSIGVELQGRTTLAANDMDYIYSGYVEDMDPKEREKYKSSGIPKRATGFGTNAVAYGLDKKSFKGGQRSEIILDNWKPVSLILSNKAMMLLVDGANNNLMPSFWVQASGIAECVEYFYTKVDLPVKNQKGEIQPKESIMNLVDKTLDRYDAITKGGDILTQEGVNMSKFDLKQFVIETLAESFTESRDLEEKVVSRMAGGKLRKAPEWMASLAQKPGGRTAIAKKAAGWAEKPWAVAQAALGAGSGSFKKANESDKKEAQTCSECGAMYEGAGCNECGY